MCHLAADLIHWGPSCNVSTSTFEHAQGHVKLFAERNTKNPEEFGFFQYTAWQCQCLAEIQREETGYTDSTWLKAQQACTDIVDLGDKRGIIYWGHTICPGSIIMHFKDLTKEEITTKIQQQHVMALFSYSQVMSLDATTETAIVIDLKQPNSGSLALQPFPLQPYKSSAREINLTSCNRVVASISWNRSQQVIPTRFL